MSLVLTPFYKLYKLNKHYKARLPLALYRAGHALSPADKKKDARHTIPNPATHFHAKGKGTTICSTFDRYRRGQLRKPLQGISDRGGDDVEHTTENPFF